MNTKPVHAFLSYALVAAATAVSLHAQNSAAIVTGSKVTLFASADGTQPMTFTWYHNGLVVGEGISYLIPSFTAADAGAYHVVARNDAGSASSQTQFLIVNGDVRAKPGNLKLEVLP